MRKSPHQKSWKLRPEIELYNSATTRGALETKVNLKPEKVHSMLEHYRHLFKQKISEPQRASFSTVSGISICPKLSIAPEGQQIGRQVHFHSKTSQAKHFQEVKHSISDIANVFDEQIVVESLKDKVYIRTLFSFSSSSGPVKDDSWESVEEDVVFQGTQKSQGKSQLAYYADIVPDTNARASLMVKTDDSCQADSELWPWPWLDPETRALSLYMQTPVFYNDVSNWITFKYQESLPPLPKPSFSNALSRYLESAEVYMPANRFKQLQETSNELKECLGLQETENLEHLVSTVWENTDLYSRQEALLTNTSIVAPFLHDLWPPNENTQLERATTLVSLALEFWQMIRLECLKPISDGRDNFINMESFLYLFSSVKIPGIPKDEAHTFFQTGVSEEMPRHILVIHHGQMFSVEVVDSDLTILNPGEIKRALVEIMETINEGLITANRGIGVMTSADRNKWSWFRKELMDFSAENRGDLQEIERAIFVLSLDHNSVKLKDSFPCEAVFADGCNRWYDKSLNFYVYANGVVTVNSNSSLVDGQTVAVLLNFIHLKLMEDANKWDDEIFRAMSARSSRMQSRQISRVSSVVDQLLQSATKDSHVHFVAVDEETPHSSAELRALQFNINETMEEEIQLSRLTFQALSDMLQTAVCTFEMYASDLFPSKKINEDAFAHLVLHLTLYRMYHTLAPVRSKIHLKRFNNARHDWLHTSTMESLAWSKAMMDPDSTKEQRQQLFRTAQRKHIALLKECASGQGFDNYLTALLCKEEKISDETARSQLDVLKSCVDEYRVLVHAECVRALSPGVAVVLPHDLFSYGVGYSVASTKVTYYTTSWSESQNTCAELLAANLQHTLDSLENFLSDM